MILLISFGREDKMKVWLSIFWNELRYYRRSWLIIGGLLCTPLYMFWGFYQFMREGNQVGTYVVATSYIVLACIFIGYIFGITSIENERESKMEQYLLSMPGDRYRITSKLCSWLFFCFVFLLLSNLILYLSIVFIQSDFIHLYYEIFIYIFSYWGTALFGSYVIGMTVSLLSSTRWIQIAGAIIVWFLSSPFPTDWLRNFDFPKLILTGLYWLTRTERKINVDYNEFTGISLSKIVIFKHLSFVLFTLFVLFLVIAIKNPRFYSIGTRIKYAGTGFMLFIFFSLVLPHSFSVLDRTSANSYTDLRLEEDKQFYGQQPVVDDQTKNELIAKRYDIKLSHQGETVEYEADIELEVTSAMTDSYVFTLYRGFDVLSLTVNDEVANWTRNGDYLIIEQPNSKPSHFQLKVQVTGQGGGKSLVTDNSFYLAEDFPWFPIAGKHAIAFVAPYFYEPQYISNMLPQESEFEVQVVSPPRQGVFSNLSSIGVNQFRGKAHGLMLVSSNLLQGRVDKYEIVAPPDLQDQLRASIHGMQQTIHQMANWLDVEPTQFPKKMVLAPSYSTWNQDILQGMSDNIVINSNIASRQPDRLYNVEVVFYSFYWKNKLTSKQYREKMSDSILLSKLIGEEYGNYKNSLQELADQYTKYNKKDPLYVKANRIIQWENKAQKEDVKKLIKVAYGYLLNSDTNEDVWEKSMREVNGDGAANLATD